MVFVFSQLISADNDAYFLFGRLKYVESVAKPGTILCLSTFFSTVFSIWNLFAPTRKRGKQCCYEPLSQLLKLGLLH